MIFNSFQIDDQKFQSKSGDAAKSLKLLVVEDDQMSREMLLMYLQKRFDSVIIASDGDEGFRQFCKSSPDIVLTDQVMPAMSGLELIGRIRDAGFSTPVILITSSIDNEILLQAINLDVKKFVPKPFNIGLIIRILDEIAQNIVNARFTELYRQQEIDRLRYRVNYNSMQQEAALRKERHVVKHDLQGRVLTGSAGGRWAINVAYSPHDIMCGDAYSVRNLFDGRQFIFVADAMGSGMSASLTAMLATSFFNYQVENLHLWSNFTLSIFLQRFKEYLSNMLLEEEVLSCGFWLVDLKKEEVETAMFALPPMLLRRENGGVEKISGGNPPIGIYHCESKISRLSLAGVADLLIMTDGVTDALVRGDSAGLYREELEADFCKSPTLPALRRCFNKKTSAEDQDDLTMLHLRRLDATSHWGWSDEPELSLSGLNITIDSFLDALMEESAVTAGERYVLSMILIEAMMNAYEHGCLNIDPDNKIKLLMRGEYEDALEGMEHLPDTVIKLSASLWRTASKPLLMLEVKDNGSGLSEGGLQYFTSDAFMDGNGLKTISRLSDYLYIGSSSGTLIILKTLEGEDIYAD